MIKFTDAENKLNAAFANHGFSLFLVGGAVRDALIGVDSKDKDFATDATPDEQIAVYEAAGIRYIPTGLQHGTLTAIVDDELFEVTTFRTERDHDGRYATVEFTRNIEDDLGRRDLTINAMAVAVTNPNVVIDPYDGMFDLMNRTVRFVGNPVDRIREDYLRILRWVRFHQRFAHDMPFDPDTVEAVKKNVDGLAQISVERVWAEISKTLTYPNAMAMFDLLLDTGIAKAIGLPRGSYYWMSQADEGTRDPVSIMAAYNRRSIEKLADSWKWSNEEKRQGMTIAKLLDRILDEPVQQWLVAVDGYRPYDVAEAARILNYPTSIETWEIPTFPISGKDLIEMGIKPSAELGAILRRMKEKWAQKGFNATKRELLTEAY